MFKFVKCVYVCNQNGLSPTGGTHRVIYFAFFPKQPFNHSSAQVYQKQNQIQYISIYILDI